MLVPEVMTEDVVTIGTEHALGDAVERTLEFGTGSVIVTRDGDPIGIATETDVLISGHESGEPLQAASIEAATSHPLGAMEPEATVRAAVERMRRSRIKKRSVAHGIDVVGILTREGVVFAHPELVKGATRHEARRAE